MTTASDVAPAAAPPQTHHTADHTAAPTAPPSENTSGLPSLGPEGTALLRQLDDAFESWAVAAGARVMTMPPLLPAADLARLDYYDNFPQQAVVAAPLDLGQPSPGSLCREAGHFPNGTLQPAALGLPSASCYGVFLDHQGQQVAGNTLVSVVGWCFRQEEHYVGLRRQLGFRMREIVALGDSEHAEEHLVTFTETITAFADALDLPLRKEAACDPFYDRGSSKAMLQRLSPVKHEFLYDDLAIASVNTHRNFFGERCDISAADGSPVFTSCVAFGLERWLSALTRRHGSWEAAAEAVRRAT